MTALSLTSPDEIRAARAQHPDLRARDFADKFSISEAQLIAAEIDAGGDTQVVRISANPDDIMPRLNALGEVMALTRNNSCVIEKVGTYDNYHPGKHAAMILTPEIDLRIFPSRWVHAFAVTAPTKSGLRRSLQVFDAAGDAVHKIFLRDTSDLAAWESIVADLRSPDQGAALDVTQRVPPEAPKADPEKAETLRAEWAKMTDTHQFMRLTSKLKMNRLGAYRIAGEPLARAIAPDAITGLLEQVRDRELGVMIFVGNTGCIEIHGGPIKSLKPMGPWQNVLDPEFNLHLRLDRIAEVWAVTKPTQRGPAVSVEAFAAGGEIIFQIFAQRNDGTDHRPAWEAIVADLPPLQHAAEVE